MNINFLIYSKSCKNSAAKTNFSKLAHSFLRAYFPKHELIEVFSSDQLKNASSSFKLVVTDSPLRFLFSSFYIYSTYIHHLRPIHLCIKDIDLYELRKYLFLMIMKFNPRTKFVSVSNTTKKMISALVHPSRVIVNGNPPTAIALTHSQNYSSSERPSLLTESLTFLFIARYAKRKNFNKCADLISQLLLKIPSIKLVIVTDNAGSQFIKNSKQFSSIRTHINVKINISDDELRESILSSNFLLCTSDCEGFYYPLFEALSFNRFTFLPKLPIFIEMAGHDYPLYYTSSRDILDFINTGFNQYDSRELAMSILSKHNWSYR